MNLMKRIGTGEFKKVWGAEANSGGSICTKSRAFIPVPQVKIFFELRQTEYINFEGKAFEESDGRGLLRVEIGLRVDGTYYSGSSQGSFSGQTEIIHFVDRILRLKKGFHEAELVFRAIGNSTGSIFLLPSFPASLEAGY